jgi:hypothetical protein
MKRVSPVAFSGPLPTPMMNGVVRGLLWLILLAQARREPSMRKLIDCAALCGGAIVLAFVLTLFIGYATAQEGHIGHGHDTWHQSFYSTLKRPDGKGSCCNLTDCRPTSIRSNNGRYEIKKDGRWIPVQMEKVVRKTAPDGGAHICAPDSDSKFHAADEVFCVIMPLET